MLAPGTRLGVYEIVAPLGAGGMGEVYRARDTKLNRDVALKTLPKHFALDADRLARFEREARTLASVNHSNIAIVHGLETSDGACAIVMELVEGPTLADRLARGAMPIEEVLPIAKQIAEALEAAHDQGIVHRDLKPSNIKLRPDGTVKVLDFGLAKASDAAGMPATALSTSPTITTPAMTQAGIILGTAAYMSPEQARGKPVDRRTDMWAFGAVVYEMLTGRQAFRGEDVGEMLAAVLKTEVDWSLLPSITPEGIRRLIQRCLRKDQRQRLGDAAAARIEIEDALAAPVAAAPVSSWQRRIPFLVAVPVGLISVALAVTIDRWMRRLPEPERSGFARLMMPLPRGTELPEGQSLAISPDGGSVAYVGQRGTQPQLFLRALSGPDARALAGTEGATSPFFSPDGQWIGFISADKVKKVSATAGVVVPLADAYGNGGATWGPDDTIVYAATNRRALMEVPAGGGAPREVMPGDPGGLVRNPAFLPGGSALLLTTSPTGAATADESSIEIVTIRTGQRKVLVRGGYAGNYLPTGHLVFQRNGTIAAARLDLERQELTSAPGVVVEGIRQAFNGVGAFSCSRSGTCVYAAGASLTQRTVTLVDRAGTSRPLQLPARNYGQPRFSPNGDRLVFWLQQIRCDIEVYDVARGATTRLTDEGDNHFPTWTPDGQQVIYISRKRDAKGYELFSRPANGGPEERLSTVELDLDAVSPIALSPDGRTVAFTHRDDIWIISRPNKAEPKPFVQSRFKETMPVFSPDGRWLAFVGDESGRSEVYVQPFPGPGGKYPVSVDGGTEPVWARNGRELFFRNGDQVMVAEVTTQLGFSAGHPRVLFSGPFARQDTHVNYDVSPDGQRFVMLNSGAQERAATEVTVLLNWFTELQRLVPAK